jgi:cytoskeletal protein CcmA (bactofilin family)
MAALGSQSIASSYEQLLHVDADGGGNTTTHVSVKDGDNGTTFALTLATDAVMITSTNRLEFGDTGTYIHQSADGVLDLVSDTEIELNGTIDINGAVDMSSTLTLAGNADFNGDLDVDGTTNLDVVDIDGAVDMASTLAIGGDVTMTQAGQAIFHVNSTGDAAEVRLTSDVGGAAKVWSIQSDNVVDKFTITDGSTIYLSVDSTGSITAPVNPAFLAIPASSQDDIAMNTDVTILFGTEIFDQGGDFTSNTFTAPVTGRYQLSFSVRANNIDQAAAHFLVAMVTSNRSYIDRIDPSKLSGDPATWVFNLSCLADMDASDTVFIRCNSAAGTAQIDIPTEAKFSGYLAC